MEKFKCPDCGVTLTCPNGCCPKLHTCTDDEYSPRKEVMYAIGQADFDGGYGMWKGPTPSEKEMLEVIGIGRDNNSVIIRFNLDGTDEVIWRWDTDRWTRVTW